MIKWAKRRKKGEEGEGDGEKGREEGEEGRKDGRRGCRDKGGKQRMAVRKGKRTGKNILR